MKISAKTMAAARKAAAKQNLSVDRWADTVLAKAAAPRQQTNVEALLHDISRKIDEIADRQSFGEKANEQIAAAVDEIGLSFKKMKKRTGYALGTARTKAGTAVGEMTGKALEAIGQMSKSATGFAGSLTSSTATEREDDRQSVEEPPPEKKPRARRTPKAGKTPRRRSSAAASA
jgi:hypothetical protein